jgi:hypothetical protein
MVQRVPDSITDWILNLYCISSTNGIGISEPKVIKVFQPFFVTVDLPYSAVKGETFPVRASILNYETTCVPVLIEIIIDRTSLAIVDSNNKRSLKRCICADEKITEVFHLKALTSQMDSGVFIKIKIKSINNDADVCNVSQKINKIIRFVDSEARKILIEVILFIYLLN